MLNMLFVKKHIPNYITVLRIGLIIPIVYFLVTEQYIWGLVFFTIAGLSDALDGLLARRFHWQTWWGSLLDPVADKSLLVLSFLALYWIGWVPLWILLVLVVRDIIVIGGAGAYHILFGKYEFRPTFISKSNTFLQLIFIILSLLHLSFAIPPMLWININLWLMLLTTLVSLIDYVWVWSNKAISNTR